MQGKVIKVELALWVTLARATKKTWAKIKTDSMKEVSEKMYRCDVDLGASSSRFTKLPIDLRLEKFKQTQTDPDLMELYFQLGRYLKVSSSRPGTLSTNLQGLWAEKLWNAWQSDDHLNINIQLHYLSVEPTNLTECHEPLF